jgi:plasmid stabilization system protein ParE
VKPRAVIRPLARQEVLEQAEYIAFRSGLAMASRFLKAAERTYQLIATQP